MNLNVSFKELLAMIKQLPKNQLIKLKKELDSTVVKNSNDKTALQELLFGGPTMSEEEYIDFMKLR